MEQVKLKVILLQWIIPVAIINDWCARSQVVASMICVSIRLVISNGYTCMCCVYKMWRTAACFNGRKTQWDKLFDSDHMYICVIII